MSLQVRTMQWADLPAVHALQCAAYPASYHEPADVLSSHLNLGAETCLVAEVDGALSAYVFAHPWSGRPPELHARIQPPMVFDHLFIHDLAVSPNHQGRGAASALLAGLRAMPVISMFQELRLVAVGDAVRFWQRCGFVADAGTRPPACYGEAIVMYQPT